MNLCNKILITKSSHEANLVHSFTGNAIYNKIYDYIWSLSANNSIPSQVEFYKSVATSDLDRASLFNKFFTPSLQLVHAASHQPRLTTSPVAIDSITLSQLDILEALESLDVSKSMGVDGIPSKLCALALYTFQFTIYHRVGRLYK